MQNKKSIFLLGIGIILFTAFASADLRGYFTYIPGYDYAVTLNSTDDLIYITKQGKIGENFILPYSPASYNPLMNEFTKKINNIWFAAVFNYEFMNLRQYVGTGFTHNNLTEPILIEPDLEEYSGTIITNQKTFFLPPEQEISVLYDIPSSYVELNLDGLLIYGSIDQDQNVGSVFMGPYLIQIRLTNENSQLGLALDEWIQVNPEWQIQLNAL